MGIVLDRQAKQAFCLSSFALLAIEHGQVVLRFGILGIKRDSLLELLFGLGGISRLQQ